MFKMLLKKICTWGLDDDGDLALKIGPLVFAFYKYKEPTIMTVKEAGWKPFSNDLASRAMWDYVRNYGGGPGYFVKGEDLTGHFKGSRAMLNQANSERFIGVSRPRSSGHSTSEVRHLKSRPTPTREGMLKFVIIKDRGAEE